MEAVKCQLQYQQEHFHGESNIMYGRACHYTLHYTATGQGFSCSGIRANGMYSFLIGPFFLINELQSFCTVFSTFGCRYFVLVSIFVSFSFGECRASSPALKEVSPSLLEFGQQSELRFSLQLCDSDISSSSRKVVTFDVDRTLPGALHSEMILFIFLLFNSYIVNVIF